MVKTAPEKQTICYGLYPGRKSQQEWYETSSRDARRRAMQLRKLGLTVLVSPMGEQVTNLGRVAMTLLTVLNYGEQEIPAPAIVRL